MKKITCFVFVLVFLFCPKIYGDTAMQQKMEVIRQRVKEVGEIKAEIAKLKVQIATVSQAPTAGAKIVVAPPAPVLLVNILLVDDQGRVPECFKGVRVCDITQNGKHTHFVFDGKPIDWNQKVVFSYSYIEGDPQLTGAIYYTPAIAGAAVKVINVPPCNVYQDSDGTIRYDDLHGCFPCAPKGAGYITVQCTLPTQP